MQVTPLLLMAGLHFIAMYALMYSMVDRFENVFNNLNQVYMAGIMTTPMLIIEILLMGSMYANKRALTAIGIGSLVVFAAFFLFIRQQTAIGNEQFLRSMIPHHASAILMCEQASIDDPEIEELCGQIIQSQQQEIDLMKRILEEK